MYIKKYIYIYIYTWQHIYHTYTHMCAWFLNTAKNAYTFGTRPPTNWSLESFCSFLKCWNFLLAFSGASDGRWLMTMVYWNTWYIWSIFDFSGTWYILKHQHVEATVGASWCADGHRCHDHKTGEGNLQDTTISTRQQVAQLLNQAQPRGRLRFKWQWTSKKYVVWWYGSWYDMMIFFFGRWKRTSSIWFSCEYLCWEQVDFLLFKDKKRIRMPWRILQTLKSLYVFWFWKHTRPRRLVSYKQCSGKFTKRSADGIPWHCGPGSASKHWEKIR